MKLTASADEAADALRSQIQRGVLGPGEWLREARICGELGIGRSIARRALRALADDGLVELHENRGACVSTTTVQEVFDLYETRAALYGLAVRFTCLRASVPTITRIIALIDRLLAEAEDGAPAAQVIETSEAIFTEMAQSASRDAQKMIEAIRRKTRWHFSYSALALGAAGPGPYSFWREIRAALTARNAEHAATAARNILYFMQNEVSRMILTRGPLVLAPLEPVAAGGTA